LFQAQSVMPFTNNNIDGVGQILSSGISHFAELRRSKPRTQ
jgi:hypothetical protein